MSRSVIWIVNGVVFGASWAAGQEIFRLQKSGTKTCTKCLAPVGNNGIWSGEREPRSYSFAYGVNSSEWNFKERIERRRKCYGCRKSLDPTSVVVLDRSWHRKCVKCTACEKAITGPRYYMLNNQIFDQACFHQARRNPRLQRSHTAIIDLRYPSPLTSEDLDTSNSASQIPSTTTTILSNNEQNKTRLPNIPLHSQTPPKLTRNYSISSNRDSISDEPGKMSQEMKRKLANDLLSTLTTLRIREWRKRSTASTFNQIDSLKEMNTENEEAEKKSLSQQKESNKTQSSFTDNN